MSISTGQWIVQEPKMAYQNDSAHVNIHQTFEYRLYTITTAEHPAAEIGCGTIESGNLTARVWQLGWQPIKDCKGEGKIDSIKSACYIRPSYLTSTRTADYLLIRSICSFHTGVMKYDSIIITPDSEHSLFTATPLY